MLSKGFEVRFMNKKFGEIDFIIQNNRNAVSLEIKSGIAGNISALVYDNFSEKKRNTKNTIFEVSLNEI